MNNPNNTPGQASRKKTAQDARLFIERVAQHNGWAVNPDRQFVDDLAEGLAVNYNRHGYFLCPCRDGDGERERDRDIICPCDYITPDQQEFGHCFCGLFLTPEFAVKNEAPTQIPERRPEA